MKDFGEAPLENTEDSAKKCSQMKRVLWFASISRNVVVVIGCSVLAFFLKKGGYDVFSLTGIIHKIKQISDNLQELFLGSLPNGLPNVTFPKIEVNYEGTNYSFIEMAKQLGSGILVVPFIAVLGNVAIAKAFGEFHSLPSLL